MGGTSGSIPVQSGSSCPIVAASNADWLSPTVLNGSVAYTVEPNSSFSPRTGVVTISGQPFTITQGGAAATPPQGAIDTPAAVSTGVSGAIGITGWAVGQAGISKVEFWREPNPGETTGTSLVFVTKAVTVPGVRPDIRSVCPTCPGNDSGWGAQILTNELPSNNGPAGVGNGTYKIHVLVSDNASQTVDLGVRTITTDNAHAKLPFGTIDTPQAGEVVSGAHYVNFGWAVTPNPANVVPKDGSTLWVFIDNQPVGHPVYNNTRSDISSLFPGLQNSNGAVGYFYIDSTKLSNGLHTIAWSVQDSAGNAQGLGSRFFNVQN